MFIKFESSDQAYVLALALNIWSVVTNVQCIQLKPTPGFIIDALQLPGAA